MAHEVGEVQLGCVSIQSALKSQLPQTLVNVYGVFFAVY